MYFKNIHHIFEKYPMCMRKMFHVCSKNFVLRKTRHVLKKTIKSYKETTRKANKDKKTQEHQSIKKMKTKNNEKTKETKVK
jgi:hypothetical protein